MCHVYPRCWSMKPKPFIPFLRTALPSLHLPSPWLRKEHFQAAACVVVGGDLTSISGYLNSYIRLQPWVKWARCSHRRSSQTSVSTTDPSGLAKHWSWQSVPGMCPVLEQQQGLQVHWQSCFPGVCALPGQCLALPLATSMQPYLWLQSKENVQGRAVLCLSSALCVTWVAAVAVWRSRQRVWLAAGLGLLQTVFVILCAGLEALLKAARCS